MVFFPFFSCEETRASSRVRGRIKNLFLSPKLERMKPPLLQQKEKRVQNLYLCFSCPKKKSLSSLFFLFFFFPVFLLLLHFFYFVAVAFSQVCFLLPVHTFYLLAVFLSSLSPSLSLSCLSSNGHSCEVILSETPWVFLSISCLVSVLPVKVTFQP